MYYIYILHSESSDIYYVGYTNNYHNRLEEHNTTDRNTFSSKHRLWALKAVFECGDNEGDAMKLERFIKEQKSKLFIETLIRSNNLTGKLAQLVRVPNLRD